MSAQNTNSHAEGRKVAWGGQNSAPDLTNIFDQPDNTTSSTDAAGEQNDGGAFANIFNEPTPPPAQKNNSPEPEGNNAFANIFDSETPSEPQQGTTEETSEPADDGAGLNELFGASTQPEVAEGLQNVFGETTPATPPTDSATEEPGAVPTEADKPFEGQQQTNDSPFGQTPDAAPDFTSDNPPPFGTPPSSDNSGAAASPFGEPTNTTPTQTPSDTATSGGGKRGMAAMRAAVAAQQEAGTALNAPTSDAILKLATEERYVRAAELEMEVARILGLGRGNDALVRFAKRQELTRDVKLEQQQRHEYGELLKPHLIQSGVTLNERDLELVLDIAYDEFLGIGPLGPLWRDPEVSEIMVSGPDKVTVERNGRLETTPVKFRDLQHLEEIAKTLSHASYDDRGVSPTNPLVTLQLPGARVQFVWKPLAVSKVAISIRKFMDLLGMDNLLELGSISPEMADFLRRCVESRATILVSGGTGSGKTTFINALSEFIPDTERVITIEDALELQLRNTHVESLVTKEAASADDRVLFGQDQLLKASLRMRPDRIIVGEIRDGAGCSVMLEAANTGHAGTMTTIHADSTDLALKRMGTLIRRVDDMPDEVARSEISTAIDVVVQVVRTRGKRYVSEISVVNAGDKANTTIIYRGDYPHGAQKPVFKRVNDVGADTGLAMKMLDAGHNPNTKEEQQK